MTKMTPHKILFPFLLAAIFSCCHSVSVEELDTSAPPSSTTASNAAAAAIYTNSTRNARLMKYLNKDLKTLPRKHFRIPPKLRARADHNAPPAAARLSANYRRAPAPPAYMSPRPQPLRRAHNGVPAAATQRFSYESNSKNAHYSGAKGTVPFNAGKTSIYRPQFAQMHPNAISPQVLSSMQQQQQHQQQQQQHYNFKASPPFNGQAIVRPVGEQHDMQYAHYQQQAHSPQQHLAHQQPVQQYPIPPQTQSAQSPAQLANYQTQQQQQQAPQTVYKPLFHYERPHEEPVLHPHVKHEHGPERPSYAVYEDGNNQQPASNHNYFISSTEAAEREAQDYLKFMSSNEYFLPKREPDYRKLDAAQHQQMHYQQPQQPQQSQQYQQQQQQSQQSVSASQSQFQYGKALNEAANAAASSNFLNTPIQVSQLFYQEDPVPPPSSAVVRGSYQAGNNMFVVNSDGNKAVKHIVQSPLPTAMLPTTPAAPAASYAKAHYNTYKHHTPEPVRFEFTERDAVTSSYTNAPSHGQQQQHLRYKAVAVATPSTPPTLGSTLSTAGTAGSNYNGNALSGDDAEDNEDIHEASSSSYGRIPVQLGNVASSATSPIEQKDNEDYCERICASVQDDDEEIVCGSDGYMYTSEAQMECYASCLHIDVTIQSKGSCSAS